MWIDGKPSRSKPTKPPKCPSNFRIWWFCRKRGVTWKVKVKTVVLWLEKEVVSMLIKLLCDQCPSYLTWWASYRICRASYRISKAMALLIQSNYQSKLRVNPNYISWSDSSSAIHISDEGVNFSDYCDVMILVSVFFLAGEFQWIQDLETPPKNVQSLECDWSYARRNLELCNIYVIHCR